MSRRERFVVRTASVAIVAGGAAAVATTETPSTLPAAALGSALVLYVERLAIVVAALLFVAVTAVRGWRGDLPETMSERGAEWGPLDRQRESSDEQLAALKGEVDELRESVAVLRRHVFFRQ